MLPSTTLYNRPATFGQSGKQFVPLGGQGVSYFAYFSGTSWYATLGAWVNVSMLNESMHGGK